VNSDLAVGVVAQRVAASQLWMGEFSAARENSEKAIEISATTFRATCR